MAQGKGSAIAVAAVLLSLFLLSEMAQAKVYNVGDAKGWTFNVTSWTKGKKFWANDILLFNYPSKAHNVVVLKNNKVAYNWCIKPKGSKVYQTGKDRLTLVKGDNFFMCGFPGHCKAGMKIAIKAL